MFSTFYRTSHEQAMRSAIAGALREVAKMIEERPFLSQELPSVPMTIRVSIDVDGDMYRAIAEIDEACDAA